MPDAAADGTYATDHATGGFIEGANASVVGGKGSLGQGTEMGGVSEDDVDLVAAMTALEGDATPPENIAKHSADTVQGAGGAIDAVAMQPAAPRSGGNSIIVNMVQKGNSVLKHIRNVPWEFASIIPDFVLGQTTCAFFLSLRYHGMHPSYLLGRVKELGRQYRLRILLVFVDTSDTQEALKELAKFCIVHNLCMMLAWTLVEAARYLETYKTYENKPPDQLQQRVAKDYMSQLTSCLTSVKSINKTDVVTLASAFGCLHGIATACVDDLRLCPGFGDRKAERLAALLDEPFLKDTKKSK